jgi:transposase
MLTVLAELGVSELVTSIPGISALGAATILAQTGDLGITGKGPARAPRQWSTGATGRRRVMAE